MLDIVYNPCEPVVIVPAADASGAEIASIDAAIAMWNNTAGTRLRRDQALHDEGEGSSSAASAVSTGGMGDIHGAAEQRLVLLFEHAAPMFYGIYRDENGDVVINRRLRHHRERAVTIAHELGHAFGLWHVSKRAPASVMKAQNLTQGPTARDARAIGALWGVCGPS